MYFDIKTKRGLILSSILIIYFMFINHVSAQNAFSHSKKDVRKVEMLGFNSKDLLQAVGDSSNHTYNIPIYEVDIDKKQLIFSNFKKAIGILKIPDQKVSPKKYAIIDSGIMTNHPVIKPFILKSYDLTGEGIEDYWGHGSMVTLAVLSRLAGKDIDALFRTRLIIIKVIPKKGDSGGQLLIKGLKLAQKEKVDAINISLGIYDDKCKGDCPVCLAAERVAKSGIRIYASAGNIPGTTCCPAKIGLYKQEMGVESVGASDFPSSGEGNRYEPSGMFIYHFQ